jgi:nicotinamide mononucleotide transporter
VLLEQYQNFLVRMHIFKQLLKYLNVDFIQFAVLILGVAEVLLARANNVWLYPTGIAAVVLSIYSLFNAQLFAECFLNFYYLVMSIYGWRYWITKQNDREIKVTNSSKREWQVALSIVFGGWILLYFILLKFTPSDVPSWDAFVSATGWAGMWLLAKRKVENWIFLNVSNAFAIPLLLYKDLPWLALLTAILFLVACKGYFDWRKIAREQPVLL